MCDFGNVRIYMIFFYYWNVCYRSGGGWDNGEGAMLDG